MSRLYELSNDFESLYDQLDDLDPEENAEALDAYFQTIDAIEQEFDMEAEALGVFYKRLIADDAKFKAEIDLLRRRKNASSLKAERVKHFLLLLMDRMHLSKAGGVRAQLSVRNNPESVTVVNFDALIEATGEQYIRPRQVTEKDVNKTDLKAALKEGATIPGVDLTRTRSVIIK